jgi:hypothetical protein
MDTTKPDSSGVPSSGGKISPASARLADRQAPQPMSLEELTKRADFLKSQLPADVRERVQTRSKVAREAAARYWAETD